MPVRLVGMVMVMVFVFVLVVLIMTVSLMLMVRVVMSLIMLVMLMPFHQQTRYHQQREQQFHNKYHLSHPTGPSNIAHTLILQLPHTRPSSPTHSPCTLRTPSPHLHTFPIFLREGLTVPLVILTIMDDRNFKLAEQLVNPTYIRLAQNSLNRRDRMVRELLTQRQLPEEPIDDLTIRYILDTLALMDSNNFHQKTGVGERESRVFSRLVEERHFHMGHGIGRSGDVTANQPKAAGSSLLLQLARYLTVSALHELNYLFVSSVLLLPLATGMTISLGLLTLAEMRPARKYVLWSRIDQKTCLKAIITANLIPACIELEQKGDFLTTDLEGFQKRIQQIGPENILAIASTTSCFAPRVPDRVEELSIMAKKYGIYHLVNNAYGIWCSKIANSIKQGMRQGECTIVVQSTDKNFMVPVGGAFVFAQQPNLLDKISSKYPGRASGSPIVDLFITLLSMGKSTIRELRKERKACFELMGALAKETANKHKCRVLESPTNTISMAMQLQLEGIESSHLTELGSILYSKRVMGHRIIVPAEKVSKIGELSFRNYGSHAEKYPLMPYITFASAVGTKAQELRQFFKRLQESIKELKKKIGKQQSKKQKPASTSHQHQSEAKMEQVGLDQASQPAKEVKQQANHQIREQFTKSAL